LLPIGPRITIEQAVDKIDEEMKGGQTYCVAEHKKFVGELLVLGFCLCQLMFKVLYVLVPCFYHISKALYLPLTCFHVIFKAHEMTLLPHNNSR
jgi:hypothetical protein